ncbi:serine carboxypeptidase domain-containing protein [Ditylenchus destructor]|uniref:Serine carboxypeptidase domain-containing protein n=1 Tax=Ditylenchus destructor TaxID=166010 RepID=A0AAD4MRR4_9BILA|nr:serine carboxypeptidase domain-containing protein [Ditylenchus destructor]
MVLFYINFFVFFAVTRFLLSEAYIQNGTDEILRLPGLDSELSSRQFSGFLSATETNLLHYWFVESQSQPASDPLVFWFNGGPGCSSMLGFLNEMAPYRASNDGQTLIENHDAWNKKKWVGFTIGRYGNAKESLYRLATEEFANNCAQRQILI